MKGDAKLLLSKKDSVCASVSTSGAEHVSFASRRARVFIIIFIVLWLYRAALESTLGTFWPPDSVFFEVVRGHTSSHINTGPMGPCFL